MDLLRDKAVLVSINVHRWEINIHDKAASQEVAHNKKLADPKLVRVWKARMPDNKFVSAINGAAATARKVHRDNSFPWVQEGTRLLPTKNYVAYMDRMRECKEHFMETVTAFCAQFDSLKDDARASLNTMYKEADYPNLEGLRAYFGFETHVFPVPAGHMFTAQVDEAEMARVRDDVEKSVQQAFRDANRDLWGRLYKTIRKMQERLAEPKHVREESLTGLREMLQLLDRLNVSGDQQLESLRKQAEKQLEGMTLDSFKEDVGRREDALEEVKRIEKAMMGFMGGDAHEE